MKKFISLACVLALLFVSIFTGVYALDTTPLDSVQSGAYIVMDQTTGQVLISKNEDNQMYPASTTKIMTLALAMQKCGGDFSTPLTVSNDAITRTGSGASCAGFYIGEEISLADAMYGCLLVSGNDAANVLAEYVSGSIDEFVVLMNQTAQTIGMSSTHFANAHGYYAADHYTSTRDMAVLTQWAMSVPGFSSFFGTTSYDMPATNKCPDGRVFNTSNVMMVTSTLQYPGTTGGKSGWTEESRFTQVETCTRDGRSFITVVFDCPQKYQKFKDCIALLDYVYANYAPVTWTPTAAQTAESTVVTADGTALDKVTLKAEPVVLELPTDMTLDNVTFTANNAETYTLGDTIAPTFTLELKDGAGNLVSTVANGKMSVSGYAELLAEVEQNGVESLANPVRSWLSAAAKILLRIILIAVVAAFVLLLVLVLYCLYLKRKQEKRRAARRRAAMRRRRLEQQYGRLPSGAPRIAADYECNGLRVEIGGRQRGTQPIAAAVNQNARPRYTTRRNGMVAQVHTVNVRTRNMYR